MNENLTMLLTKVEDLTDEELLVLLEQVVTQMRHNGSRPNGKTKPKVATNKSPDYVLREAGYRQTPEEIEAELAEIFTPQELAEFAEVDLSKLPQGTKSLSQMINEDREDRF